MQIRNIKISPLPSENNYGLPVLAGYMKKLGGSIVDSFEGKIVNTTPPYCQNMAAKGYMDQRFVKESKKRQGISPRCYRASSEL